MKRVIEKRKNQISETIGAMSDGDLCILIEEIADFKKKGILIDNSNLSRIAEELHEKFKMPNDIRMVEDAVLFEAARRYYNLVMWN